MKIISEFQDYYDCIRAYGADPKLLYIRKTSELEKQEPIDIGYSPPPPPSSSGNSIYRGFIAFCGKAYPLYLAPAMLKWKAFYSFDKLYQHIQERAKTAAADNAYHYKQYLKEISEPWPWKHYLGEEYLCQESWDRFCKTRKIDIDDAWFRKYKAPVFLYLEKRAVWRTREANITINPCLKDYNFASQVDPFQAYQQIAMYVGNNLVTQMDPDPYISDELRAHSAGFDKWSFRKKKE